MPYIHRILMLCSNLQVISMEKWKGTMTMMTRPARAILQSILPRKTTWTLGPQLTLRSKHGGIPCYRTMGPTVMLRKFFVTHACTSIDTAHGFASSASQISLELSAVLLKPHPWISFLDVPLFFATLSSSAERYTIQPSLVLAFLAVGILKNSNEENQGRRGRTRARKFLLLSLSSKTSLFFVVWLRDLAQSALEASLNASWIEPSLVQAAHVRGLQRLQNLCQSHVLFRFSPSLKPVSTLSTAARVVAHRCFWSTRLFSLFR